MFEHTHEISSLLVTAVLSAVIILSFVKLLFVGIIYKKSSPITMKIAQQDLVRLIGGSFVFLVAIIAANPWIYFVSFLIGGLLIASERFMILLAGVLSSDRKNVHKIIEHTSELSYSEVDERVDQEAEDLVMSEAENEHDEKSNESDPSADDTNPGMKAQANDNEKLIIARSQVKQFEDAVYKRVEQLFFLSTQVLRRNIKLTGRSGASRIYDIAVLDEGNILYSTAEIKYLGKMNLASVRRAMKDTEFVSSPRGDLKDVRIFGFSDYDYDTTHKLLEYRRKLKLSDEAVGLVFYQLIEEDTGKFSLSVINDEDLRMLNDPQKVIF